jgi:hypothetical protein
VIAAVTAVVIASALGAPDVALTAAAPRPRSICLSSRL